MRVCGETYVAYCLGHQGWKVTVMSWRCLAATSTSYLIKLELCRTICVIDRHHSLKPQPPPFLLHAPSQSLCIHKAIIWTRRSSIGAQGFSTAFLWQHRGTSADFRNTSKPSQHRYQALPAVITTHRRFCCNISSITDGGLAAICTHSCKLGRMC